MDRANTPFRIGISGSYGGMNLGDEAILDGRAALNGVDVITVRDKQARRLLEDVCVEREIHLTADPALLLREQPLPIEAIKAEGVEFERHLVGLSVREPGPAAPDIDPEEYDSLLANAADFVIERLDADVVFVFMERTDVQHSHAVVAHMKNAERAEVLRRTYTPQQILTFVGHLCTHASPAGDTSTSAAGRSRSRMAPFGSTRSSGAWARPRGCSPRFASIAGCRRARCAPREGCSPISRRS